MGKIGDQIVFAVCFIFHCLFVTLHGRFDLCHLGSNLRIGRGEYIV